MNSERLSRKIRLTPLEIEHIIKSFKKYFPEGDELWVFGSRADMQAKGGDIDLYIETLLENLDAVGKRETSFWIDLQNRIGEQKIDIVVKQINEEKKTDLFIYEMAKKYGVKIVSKQEQVDFLKNQIETTDTHSRIILKSLDHLKTMLPISADNLKIMPLSDLGIIEILLSRFSKLQDEIGKKIFPKMLILMGEDIQTSSFIDILHKLEKLDILSDKAFWEQMRDVRNNWIHVYPDRPEEIAKVINGGAESAKTLVDYWETLKGIIQERIFNVLDNSDQ
jgi:hypothetical protein